MQDQTFSISLSQAALAAGSAILVMTAAAVFSTDFSIGRLVIPGDASATLENIAGAKMLFRSGVLSWLIVLICDVLVAWGLYIYLKPVSQDLSLLAAWFRIVYVAMLGAAIANLAYVLTMLDSDQLLITSSVDQLAAQVMFYIEAFDRYWSMGLIVFGIHILLLAILCIRSSYIPKLLGYWLLTGAAGYLVVHILQLMIPAQEEIIRLFGWVFILPMLGEVVLGIWLIWKGKYVRPESPL